MPNKNQAPKIINPPNQNGGRVEALVIWVLKLFSYSDS